MNVNKINTNLSFKGYENLISYSAVDKDETIGFGYMAMKLNNEDGQKDLQTWHAIQRGLLKTNNPSDYLILTNTHLGDIDVFLLNNHSIDLDEIKNSEEEKFVLKAYTLLASLIKRIIYTDHHPENKNIYLTLKELINILNKTYEDKNKAFELSLLGSKKVVKHYKTAEIINQRISQKMATYFKL